NNFSNGIGADALPYYLHNQRTVTIGGGTRNQIFSGDTATIGNCQVVFDYVNNSTESIIDYNNCMDIKPIGYTPPCNNNNGNTGIINFYDPAPTTIGEYSTAFNAHGPKWNYSTDPFWWDSQPASADGFRIIPDSCGFTLRKVTVVVPVGS